MKQQTHQAKSIFLEACEIADANQRREFLASACAGMPEIRFRVERLIAAHESADSLLDATPPPNDVPSDLTGEIIGRYKLLQKLGEGGFGVVYMAEQTSPVQRKVALKIIKPGMDSNEVVARFEAERQALAMMDHPHIAIAHLWRTRRGCSFRWL